MDNVIEKINMDELKQAVKYLEELLPSEMIGILDRNLRYEYLAEKPYMNILGYSKKDLLGTTSRKLIHPKDLEKIAITLKVGDELGENVTAFRAKHKNGSWKWLEFRGKVFQDELGEIKILIISRDITDRITAEKLLRKSEKKYRRLHEKSPNGRIIANRQGIILDCNSATEKLFGFRKKELIGRNYVNLGIFSSEQITKLKDIYKDFLKNKKLAPREIQIRRKDGSLAWVSHQSSLIKVGNDFIIEIIFQDITERKKAEQKLKTSEEKHRLIVENLSDIVIESELHGKFNFFSPQIYNMFGYETEELSKIHLYNFIHPDDFNNFAEHLKTSLTKGKTITVEFRGLHKKGHYILGSFKGRAFDDNGKIKLIGVIRDITDQKRNEQIIKESEEKYRGIIEKNYDGYYEVDLQGNFTVVDKRICKFLGYSKKELIGTNYRKYTNPDDIEKIFQAYNTLYEKELPQLILEYKTFNRDGQKKLIEVAAYLKRDRNGKKIGFYGLTRDLTIRQKLSESEEKYRLMVDNASDMIVKTDIEGRLLFVSPSYCKTFGKTEEELLGKHFLPLVHEEDRELTAKEREKLFEPPYRTHFEQRALTKDGWRWIEWSDVALLNSENKVIGGIGVGRDITTRKMVEEELIRIGKAMESTSDAIGMSDPQGHHFFQNLAFTNLFEYSAEELEKLGGGPAVYVNQDIAKNVFNTIMNGHSWAGEIEMKSKSGRVFPVLLRADAIKDNDGHIIGLIGVHTDITVRKQTEHELKESEEEFRKAFNQAEFYKDVFTHDINNILNAIQLSADLSSFYLNEPDQLNEYINVIVKHVERGAKLVSDIQKLSKLHDIAMVLESINAKKVLKESLNFLKDSVQEKELDIKIDAPQEDLFVTANDFLLDVFENILVNAVKYNDNHRVVITIKLSNFEENGANYQKIEFIDNARGIQDVEKKAILKKGFKQDRRSQGLGIGLSLVKKIIEGYNGKIWVENRIPEDYTKGSKFILLIPTAN